MIYLEIISINHFVILSEIYPNIPNIKKSTKACTGAITNQAKMLSNIPIAKRVIYPAAINTIIHSKNFKIDVI